MGPQPVPDFSRLGTESAFGVLARAEALRAKGKDIINLGIGQPDFSPPDHILKAAKEAITAGHHGYTPAPGIPALRQAVSQDLQRRHGVDIDPARVLIVPGGKVTMFQAILMFGAPGREIIYPDPGFPIYRSLIDYTGAKAVPLRLSSRHDFAPQPSDLADLITDKTSLVIINSPGNPTGGILSSAQATKIADILADHPDCALLSDEIYEGLLFDGHEHHSFLRFPKLKNQLILLDGWSKRYAMTGWRLGFAVWPEHLISLAERFCVNSHSCVNAVAQQAAIAALQGPQDSVATMRQAFEDRRNLFVKGLNDIPGFACNNPGGAFYAFADIQATGLSADLVEKRLLEEAGIAIVGGPGFGGAGEGHIRFSFAAGTDRLQEALLRLADWSAQLKSG